jgi:rod shape determining protein RodA
MPKLARVPWGIALIVAALCLIGIAFVHSASFDDEQFGHQAGKQALLLLIGAGAGGLLLLAPCPRVLRGAWPLYALAVGSLLLLPWLGAVVNGARRWYALPGFSLQPSELAKLAVILALASYLRFRGRARTFEGFVVPALIAGLPAGLVLLQPDLGSALVFAPILVAVCHAAGTPGRTLLVAIAAGGVLLLGAYAFGLHAYQKRRVDTWLQHFAWERLDEVDPTLAEPERRELREQMREAIRGPAFQPWQSLVAVGSGGLDGFGYAQGPQNRYDFLPYRSSDYVAAVVAEETGFSGMLGLLALHLLLASGLFGVALRTRERGGRLVVVGVATWLASQAAIHVAVCAWFVPAKGLPMPFVSAGGSSSVAALLGIGIALNVAAHREPVLSGDGFD